MKEINQLTRIVEALLFSVDRPLSIDRMLELFDENDRPEKQQIQEALEILKNDYQERAIELKEVASGFQFQTRQELAPWVAKLFEEKAPKYSRALLETLVLIAYRQPITRGEIEDIRGVAVNSNIIKTLQEREWIRSVGFRDVPGKPELLATTKEFLDYFGLKSLSELPPISELQDLDKMAEQLEQNLAPSSEEAAEQASENSPELSEENLEQLDQTNEMDLDESVEVQEIENVNSESEMNVLSTQNEESANEESFDSSNGIEDETVLVEQEAEEFYEVITEDSEDEEAEVALEDDAEEEQ